MRRAALLILSGVFVSASILYAADYASIRFGRTPFGWVIVTPYYVIPQKNGKIEFVFQPPEPQKCVHSLFPHAGYDACWHLSRHPEQPIRM